MRIFQPVSGRETDHYSFRSRIFCVRHVVSLIAGLPSALCFALLIICWPVQRFLGHLPVFHSFYSFLIHMYSCWCHITLRLLGIEVIEIGDDVYPLRREGALMVTEETSPFSLMIIEQTLAPHFINGPCVSIRDSPKTTMDFINKARGFFIFESENDKEVEELEKYMKNTLPQSSNKLERSVSNLESNADDTKAKILTAGMLAVLKIFRKSNRSSQEGQTELPLKWITHMSLVSTENLSFASVLTGDIFANTKIFLVRKIYSVTEVPHERGKLFDWFESRMQERQKLVDALKSNRCLPDIHGNHTPFTARPLRAGSYVFAFAFTLYFYGTYFYAIHPALVFLGYPR